MATDAVLDAIEKVEAETAPAVEAEVSEYEVGKEYTHQLAPGLTFSVREDGFLVCMNCGGVKAYENERGVTMHYNMHCDGNPKKDAVKAAREDASKREPEVDGVNIRSQRGKRLRGLDRAPTVLEEIRPRPGGMLGGPASYFINPNGATIREALVISPNGAPVIRGGVDKGGGQDHQRRMEREGFVYVGPTLTREGIRALIEAVERNRPDFILFLRESMAQCDHVIRNSDRPEVKDQQRRRKEQFSRQHEIASRPISANVLIDEMNNIMKAQKLAALSPAQREAITILMGDQVDEKLGALVDRMTHRKVQGEDGFSVSTRNAVEGDEF